MTACLPLRAVACSGEGWCGSSDCSDPHNRRGQVKSRNVRPVGREQNSPEHNDLGHIAHQRRTLPISPTRRFRSAFCTLRVFS